MAMAKPKIPLWLRIALSVLTAIVVLGLTGLGLRYWITSDSGRSFIVSQIDGRKIGPLGTIRVSGMKGDPLTAASLADIALVDDEGVWMRARDARIQWTPQRLFSGELEIAAVDIRLVEVQRRPMVAPTTKRGASPDIGLKLDHIAIDDLRLADGVLGPAASFKVTGGVARSREGAGSANLDVMPRTGPGDRLSARINWTTEGRLNGEADVHGPQGGAIAELVRAPAGTPVDLRARAAGTLTAFNADILLDFANMRIATLNVTRDGDAATLMATVEAEQWDLLDVVSERTGSPISLEAKANLADFANVRVDATAVAPAVKAMIGANVQLAGGFKLLGPVDVAASDADLSRLAHPVEGVASAQGVATITAWNDWTWQGDAEVLDFAAPGVAVASARAPGAVVTFKDQTISWEARKAEAKGARLPALKNLKPDAYVVSSRGEVNVRTRKVELTQSQVTGRPGDVTARGAYDIETGAIDLSGGAVIARLADVAPLTGSARGGWTMKRTNENAPIRIGVNAGGRNVGSPAKVLADIVGPEPEATASIVISHGRYAIESGQFTGSAVEARMTGRIADSGAIAGQATGRLRRALDLGGAKVSSLSFDAVVSGDTDAPAVALNVADGALAVGGFTISDLAGKADGTFGTHTHGSFNLTGKADGQPLTATGRFTGDKGDWRLAGVEATAGGLKLGVGQLSLADGGVDFTFSADGSLQGLAGIERGTVTAKGSVACRNDDLDMDVAGQARDIRYGLTRIRTLGFKATADGDVARLTAQLRGTVGAELDLNAIVDAKRAGEAWAGTATMDGAIDKLPVSTPQPVNWTYGGQSWSVDGNIATMNGQLTADISSAPSAHTAKLKLANLDMEALSHLLRITPVAGQVSGDASFSNTGAPEGPVADVSLRLANINPEGVSADPISMAIDGQLRANRFSATATGSGQGFKLDAAAMLPVETGAGFKVTASRTAPLDGRIAIEGSAEPLWALFGPDDQTLRGTAKADVRIAGTMASPLLTGGFTLADAQYQHGESGFSLRDIQARGDFDQRSARITEVTATDGAAGRLTAEGQIVWDNTLDGELRFNATNLRALNRDDRSATLSGEGQLAIDPDAIRVMGDMRVEQARISIEQPPSASVPTLPAIRRVNFPNQDDDAPLKPDVQRPVRLNLKVKAERRIVVFGRGLDTEWGTDLQVTGPISNPEVHGTATLIRGDLTLASKRFDFNTGSINLDGPIRDARIDISATRSTTDIEARVRLTGTPGNPKFVLESTPSLPQDEILARVLFGRSASELTGLEAAQLAAGLTQLAGGQAAFDPAGLIRQATGLDRVAFGASGGQATVSAGKYIADDVYLQVGAGGEGGVGAEVEWEPRDNLSITSSANAIGDTRLAVRWKKDY